MARKIRKVNIPLRFAHPFFTAIPPAEREPFANVGQRMTDFIDSKLNPIPHARGAAKMSLADIIGAAGAEEIKAVGELRFHAVGDTGRRPDSPQEWVAEVMARDYDVANPGRSPAFLFHLGDVIYGDSKDQAYRREFYEPYRHYPGKIIAIAGNHDGEIFPTSDPVSLRAFRHNFCSKTAEVPAVAGSIFRQTMTQPGVYWLLETPFVDIIGLYSNTAENPGYISGERPGQHQKKWLVRTLHQIQQARQVEARKALVIATHHPPFSAGGHSGSSEMLADIDEACHEIDLFPDLFLSGHAHSYQRYTRILASAGENWEIPYLVAGTGGVGSQSVPDATGQPTGDHIFVKSHKGYGFLVLTVRLDSITAEFIAVDESTRTSIDTVHVNLVSHHLI